MEGESSGDVVSVTRKDEGSSDLGDVFLEPRCIRQCGEECVGVA